MTLKLTKSRLHNDTYTLTKLDTFVLVSRSYNRMPCFFASFNCFETRILYRTLRELNELKLPNDLQAGPEKF